MVCARASEPSTDFRRAASEINHDGIERGHFRGGFFVFRCDEIFIGGDGSGEAASDDRAFDNPKIVGFLKSLAEHRVVGADGADEGFTGLTEGFGVLRRAGPQIHFLGPRLERDCLETSGNDERIAVPGILKRTQYLSFGSAEHFRLALFKVAAGVDKKSLRNLNNEIPLLGRDAAGAKNAAGRKQFRAPALRGEKESLGSEAQIRFRGGRLIFDGKMESVTRGDSPGLGESEHNVARVVWGGFKLEAALVPLGAGVGKMEAAAARQAELKRGEWLIAGVAELVDGVYANRGSRRGNELNSDFLFDNGVAGAERGGAAGDPICGSGERCGGEQRRAKNAKTLIRDQSATIVARERDGGKSDIPRMRSKLAAQRGLRPWTRTKPVPAWLRLASRTVISRSACASVMPALMWSRICFSVRPVFLRRAICDEPSVRRP